MFFPFNFKVALREIGTGSRTIFQVGNIGKHA